MARRKSQNTKLVSVIVVVALMIISAVVMNFTGLMDGAFEKAGLKTTNASDKMYVNFIDVGQGDCTLITCGEMSILIDSGEAGEAQTVINYLKNQNVDKIDCCIATHPHSDHIGSMSEVLTSFELGDVIMPDVPEKIIPTSRAYEKFLKAVSENAEDVIAAQVGQTYSYGDVKVEIFAPVKGYDDLNNESVVTKITYGTTSVMLAGDAETASESDMLKNKYDYSADILKLGHHGSKTSSSTAWLKAVSPTYAVVSCGLNNDYGHPHAQTIKKLDRMEIEYLRTDMLGDIQFISDGKTFTKVDN